MSKEKVSKELSNNFPKKGCLKNTSSNGTAPVKKVLIRDCEVPVTKNNNELTVSVALSSTRLQACSSESSEVYDLLDDECDEAFKQKLCSTLKIVEDIKKVKELNIKSRKSASVTTSKTPLKKTNIPFEEKVFKGLIELKVNDEDLGLQQSFPLKAKERVKNKDPEPVLSDYYTPSFDMEYIFYPSPPVYDVEKEWIYEPYAISDLLKELEGD